MKWVGLDSFFITMNSLGITTWGSVKHHAFGFLEDIVKGMLDFGRSLVGMSKFPVLLPCFVDTYSLIL